MTARGTAGVVSVAGRCAARLGAWVYVAGLGGRARIDAIVREIDAHWWTERPFEITLHVGACAWTWPVDRIEQQEPHRMVLSVLGAPVITTRST